MSHLAARVAAVLAALATAVFLSACTTSESRDAGDGHSDHQHSESSAAPGDDAGQAAHNAADVTFASEMMPHHKQALELTDLARDRSTDPALLELAGAIAAVQGPEMGQLADMLRSWGQDPDAAMAHHGGHSSMPGMVDDATMQRLRTLDGREFDTLWLESMISHHEGAVEMAKTELADGSSAEAKELAQHIVDTQQAEIDQMRQMLGS